MVDCLFLIAILTVIVPAAAYNGFNRRQELFLHRSELQYKPSERPTVKPVGSQFANSESSTTRLQPRGNCYGKSKSSPGSLSTQPGAPLLSSSMSSRNSANQPGPSRGPGTKNAVESSRGSGRSGTSSAKSQRSKPGATTGKSRGSVKGSYRDSARLPLKKSRTMPSLLATTDTPTSSKTPFPMESRKRRGPSDMRLLQSMTTSAGSSKDLDPDRRTTSLLVPPTRTHIEGITPRLGSEPLMYGLRPSPDYDRTSLLSSLAKFRTPSASADIPYRASTDSLPSLDSMKA